jgi:hypothetical protein
MTETEKKIKNIKKRLTSLYKKICLIELLNGILLLTVLFFLISLIVVFIELSGFNSITERRVLFYLWLSFTGVFTLLFLFFPASKLFKKLKETDYEKLSAFVGKLFPELKDSLLNALQLYNNKKDGTELKNAAITANLKKADKLNFNSGISFKVLKKIGILAFASIISMFFLFTFFGGMKKAAERIINYSCKYSVPQKYSFSVIPGNITVVKGNDVNIKIIVKGNSEPEFITLFIKDDENPVFRKKHLFTDTTFYFYTFKALTATTKYYITAENSKSKKFEIKVINPPIVSNLDIKIIPPGYSKLETIYQKDNGNIFALAGSRIMFNIVSDKILSDGALCFDDNSKTKLTIENNKAKGEIKVIKDINYFILITDTAGNKNKNPITYSVKKIIDEFPMMKIIKPEEDINLTKTEKVATILEIKDDYGISNLVIRHKLISTKFGEPEKIFTTQTIPVNKKEKKQKVFYTWNLTQRMLTAGDILSFYFELFDNDVVNGPKSVKSKLFQLRVPTLEEIIKSSDKEQNKADAELKKTLKEAEKLKEKMEKLSNELKKDDKKITWEEKNKIEETAKQFKELQKKIKQAQNKIEKSKKNLSNNNLLSKETLQKYNELQKLLNEMNNEEMKKAMERLQQQLQNMNRDKAQQTLEQMKFEEEAFKKSLERTINLLKRIRIEQKTNEIIKRTEQLKKESEKLQKKLSEKEAKQNKEELIKRNKEISNRLNELQKEMLQLQEKMKEFSDMPNDTMNKIQEEIKKQNNQRLAKQSQEMMRQNQLQQSQEMMRQISSNMKQLQQDMEQMQQQMQRQNQLQVMFDMMKSLNDIISLSKEEEKLKNESASNADKNDIKQLQKQQNISEGLQKILKQLSELSQKTFAVTPEMGKALGNAQREMKNAMQAMQNGNSSLAVYSQRGAMKYLNEAATMIKGNMEQMMNGGKGGGMMSLMQQMQKLSQQQMQLNQLTKQLKQGKLTPMQQAEMQRLAQQQELIRKSLEQLNKESKENGKSKTLAADLEQILKEMREVITDMNTKKLDDGIIKSQEHILSKLLDAQRSINERDFEKNRESEAGNTYFRKTPEELKLDEKHKKIKDELMKIIEEGYSKDYEELIKQYYEILEKETEKNIK